MNEDLSTNREALLKLLGLVRPALSTLDYIPALKHIQLANGYATSFNDISAIGVKLPSSALDLDRCVPGDVLLRALGSFNAENVMLQPNEKEGTILVSSGRSKIKVPTMPAKDFPLKMPEPTKTTPVLELSDEILTGIQRCLLSVGNDPTHPATMGITLDADDSGKAVLFATNNVTISRYQTKTKMKLPGDAPVILPAFFCEQLIALARAYPKNEVVVDLHPGALVASFYGENDSVDAMLFSKTLVDLTPLDFPKIISKHCQVEGMAAKLELIPETLDAAFQRALLILSSEQDKATKLTCGDGSLKMLSTSAMGEASDSISFKGAHPDVEAFHIDPALVAKALKPCTMLGFFNRVIVLADDKATFIHLIAHCTV